MKNKPLLTKNAIKIIIRQEANACEEKKMNKKLIAGLLTLGLVFSPVAGAVSESYATEATSSESDYDKAIYKLSIIKGYLGNFEEIKKKSDYKLADSQAREALDKAMKDAEDYSKKDEVSLVDLDNHISAIESAIKKLPENVKANLDKLKASVIKAEKVLANNSESADKDEYKNLDEENKGVKNILKDLDKADVTCDDLVKLSEKLDELSKKAIKAFEDKNEYKEPSKEDMEKLDKELGLAKKSGQENKNLDDLVADINKLIESLKNFDNSTNYLLANKDKKEAYRKALDEYTKLVAESDKITDESYDKYYQASQKLAQAWYDIEGKDPGFKVIKIETKKADDQKIIDVLNKLREFSKTKDKVIEGLKDEDLKKKYIENVGLAEFYARSYMFGNVKPLKDYKELEAYLTKLKDEINKKKAEKPGSIRVDEQFASKEAARDALKKLLESTNGIAIDNFYGSDQKDARDTYNKTRENAVKTNADKNASQDDLTKAYNEFNKSVAELNNFLRERLKKLVDDKDFRDSDKFKKADEKLIKAYDDLIKSAKEELAKDKTDANLLNNLYKNIVNAKETIDGKMTDQARRLIAEIYDYDRFIGESAYKTAASSRKDGALYAASNKYPALIKKAKDLEKNKKLDSEEAKDTLDLIEHTKAFIDGKISEKKYLSNDYYHLLKAVKNHKDYTNINQAARDRLEKALKMYEEGKEDEDKIFSALDAAIKDEAIDHFIKEMIQGENPNKTRDDLLIKLKALAEKDDEFRKSEKYTKAPKELKADYDKALEEAKVIIGKENPTEAEVKAAYDKLKGAVDKLEIRHIIDRRLVVLADKFKQNQLKIQNPADRKAIADKINALKENPYTTMEEVDKVERELDNLINSGTQAVTTTTIAPQGQVPTTTRPVSTVTNPGSIVRTGINGIAKVAAVLAVAAIILILTRKKGEKNENNK